jgi:hypothetical protein
LFLHYSFLSMFLPHFTFSFPYVSSIYFQPLSLFPPPFYLSLHSRHNRQDVTTLNPALQDAMSHLHAATEIARSIKLNSILGASRLPFTNFAMLPDIFLFVFPSSAIPYNYY